MLPRKIKQLIKEESLPDKWWVSVDGELLDNHLSVNDLMKRREGLEPHRVRILHSRIKIQKHSEWIQFEFPKKRKSKVKDQSLENLSKEEQQRLEMERTLKSIEKLKAELEARKKFIEQSELKLMRKAMDMDVKQAELEQMQEDIEGKAKKSGTYEPKFKVV